MKYDNSNTYPKEETIKSIEISEAIATEKVQSIRRFAALLAKCPAQFRSGLVYEYAYHAVVYALKDSVRNVLPSWLYMEHAAEWTRQALAEPLPSIEEYNELEREEQDLVAMQRFYECLESLDENYRWQALFTYVRSKYHPGSLFQAGEIYASAEILSQFREWQDAQGLGGFAR